MSTKSRLDKLYKTCPRIRLPEDVKILFLADLHMGDGGPEDDFVKNDPTCYKVLLDYSESGYFTVFLGDIEDIWECGSDRNKIRLAHLEVDWMLKPTDRTLRIKGNHDNSLYYPEAIVLQIGNLEIFCCHGHQGDLFNDRFWWVGQNIVRYLWVPLQWIGWHDAQKAKRKRHELQEKRLMEWADKQVFPSVFGHTHFLCNNLISTNEINDHYKNAGSWVGQGGEGIEFADGQFTDKHF